MLPIACCLLTGDGDEMVSCCCWGVSGAKRVDEAAQRQGRGGRGWGGEVWCGEARRVVVGWCGLAGQGIEARKSNTWPAGTTYVHSSRFSQCPYLLSSLNTGSILWFAILYYVLTGR